VRTIQVTSAKEMHDAVLREIKSASISSAWPSGRLSRGANGAETIKKSDAAPSLS